MAAFPIFAGQQEIMVARNIPDLVDILCRMEKESPPFGSPVQKSMARCAINLGFLTKAIQCFPDMEKHFNELLLRAEMALDTGDWASVDNYGKIITIELAKMIEARRRR